MQQELATKLYQYIVQHNPDLLEDQKRLSDYIQEKVDGVLPEVEHLLAAGCPAAIAAEIGLDRLTEELRPSRFRYIAGILERSFPKRYQELREAGTLTREVSLLIDRCNLLFDQYPLTAETLHEQPLRDTVTGLLQSYFTKTHPSHEPI